MKPRAISTRERWLLVLLPAALVIVGSFILPSGSTERRQLNTLLSNAPGDDQMRRERAQLTKAIGESRKELRRLDENLADIRRRATPDRRADAAEPETASLAHRFEQLGERLDAAGIAILSTEAVARSGSAANNTAANSWTLTLAGTWTQIADAIARPDVVPAGLVVDSIAMDPPPDGSRLRRWTIMLSASEGAPRS